MVKVKVVADSLNPVGIRLTSVEATYPRFIHAEVMTHRVFSRNAASTRAIPTKLLWKAVLENPVVPIAWGSNKAGMQAGEQLPAWKRWICRQVWLGARYPVVGAVWLLNKLGLHKQWAGRLLEPWMHITVIISSTDWRNWDSLRDSDFAQPEIQQLARGVKVARAASTPRQLTAGEWHMPYVLGWELVGAKDPLGYRDVSVARCAAVSYLRQEDKRSMESWKDLSLRLSTSKHWSPFEHVAQADDGCRRVGNFRGFTQYRKMFTGESGE